MAWFGKITSLDLDASQTSWRVGVDYYNDNTPDKLIHRVILMPLKATKNDVIAAVKDTGADVMGAFLLNTQNVIGQVVPLP